MERKNEQRGEGCTETTGLTPIHPHGKRLNFYPPCLSFGLQCYMTIFCEYQISPILGFPILPNIFSLLSPKPLSEPAHLHHPANTCWTEMNSRSRVCPVVRGPEPASNNHARCFLQPHSTSRDSSPSSNKLFHSFSTHKYPKYLGVIFLLNFPLTKSHKFASLIMFLSLAPSFYHHYCLPSDLEIFIISLKQISSTFAPSLRPPIHPTL